MRIGPRSLAGGHALYLIASGVWPIVHRGSFERVTGKKREFWLVRTVGGLALVTGISLGLAVVRRSKCPESTTLALTSGAVFAIADIHAARTQSRIYLGDLLLQSALVPRAWLGTWDRR
jgi:hypothetical protein